MNERWLMADLEEARAEIERLRKALEYYAKGDDGWGKFDIDGEMYDLGETAREALEQKPRG